MRLDLSGHPLHTRALSLSLRQAAAGRVSASASLLDLRKRGFVPVGGDLQASGIIHQMEIEAVLEVATRQVVQITARQPYVAFEASAVTAGESCRDPIGSIQALVGARLGAEWAGRVGDGLGGPRACFHVFTLAHLLGTTLEHALGQEAAIGPFERPQGQRLFRRDLIVDGSQQADRSLALGLQLLDLHFTAADGLAPAMDRFAACFEFRGTVPLALMTYAVDGAVFAERRRTADTVASAPWTRRDDVAAGVQGISLLAGATKQLRQRLDGGAADAPILDGLLMLAPALVQVFAAVTDDWSRLAQEERWVVGMGGRPDSCWMWRQDGALARTRTPEDPPRP